MMDVRRKSWVAFGVTMVSLAGCFGHGDRPELGQVTGTVTLDGEPLEGATVAFYPDYGRTVGGETNSEGFYEVMYLHGVEGAKVGHSTVKITTSIEPTDEDWRPGKSTERVPPWYNVRTILEATVEPGDNVFDFDLTTEVPEDWKRSRQ